MMAIFDEDVAARRARHRSTGGARAARGSKAQELAASLLQDQV